MKLVKAGEHFGYRIISTEKPLTILGECFGGFQGNPRNGYYIAGKRVTEEEFMEAFPIANLDL